MTSLVILGIDAADYRLVQQWELDNLLLETHAPLETLSHSLDVPATIEIWPTIATGFHPREHGLTESNDRMEWDNPILKAGSRVTQYLPADVRYRLGQLARSSADLTSAQIDESISHVFDADGARVRNWPGITPAREWGKAGEWFGAVSRGELTEREYERLELGNDGEVIGWLAGQALADVPLSGAHVHSLDHFGHVYAERPDRLRACYERMDELAGTLRETADELVILSDHGMQTTMTDDESPGVHSFESMVSTTVDCSLPDSVLEVREWVEDIHIGHQRETDTATIDAPTEHLEDLGYL